MDKNKDILNQLKKTEKPSVPNGFFDSFSDRLMSKINAEDTFLDQLPKTEQPKVPDGFFENFADQISQNVQPTKPNGKIISLKFVLTVASIAAVFALIFLMVKPDSYEPIVAENQQTEQTQDVEDYDSYLAYLDESSIVDYIVENDIDIENETSIDESVYSELDNELDDYYYGY